MFFSGLEQFWSGFLAGLPYAGDALFMKSLCVRIQENSKNVDVDHENVLKIKKMKNTNMRNPQMEVKFNNFERKRSHRWFSITF